MCVVDHESWVFLGRYRKLLYYFWSINERLAISERKEAIERVIDPQRGQWH